MLAHPLILTSLYINRKNLVKYSISELNFNVKIQVITKSRIISLIISFHILLCKKHQKKNKFFSTFSCVRIFIRFLSYLHTIKYPFKNQQAQPQTLKHLWLLKIGITPFTHIISKPLTCFSFLESYSYKLHGHIPICNS